MLFFSFLCFFFFFFFCCALLLLLNRIYVLLSFFPEKNPLPPHAVSPVSFFCTIIERGNRRPAVRPPPLRAFSHFRTFTYSTTFQPPLFSPPPYVVFGPQIFYFSFPNARHFRAFGPHGAAFLYRFRPHTAPRSMIFLAPSFFLFVFFPPSQKSTPPPIL